MAITTAIMTYRRLNSMFYNDLLLKRFMMIILDQMPPKFYGLKVAGAMFGCIYNVFSFDYNNKKILL